MALRWENLASTTHSLTPRTENRPLFFGILTPCKKPEVAGSAGHCEPGVGRFTDPHPFTCSFFTPPFCWLMFGLCAPPKILPNPVLCVEKNILFHRGHPVLQCAAFAGPTGSAFSFSALSLPDHLISHPCKEELVFSHHCPWICPQLAHTASTGRGTHFASIVPLLGFQSRTQGRTRAFLVSAPTLPTFPLRGKAGLFANWAVTVWWTRPQLAHTAPTGPVSRFPGVVSLPWLQNRTQGRTGPSLVFTAFSWCAFG